MVALAGIGDQVRQDKVTHWSPQVVGLPGTYPQAIGAIGGVGSIDNKSI